MFVDAHGNPRPIAYYLDIGRRAMRALLDPDNEPNDRLRYKIVDDALWPTAVKAGATSELGPLVGLGREDSRVVLLMGDVLVITQWAEAMVATGALVHDLRTSTGDAAVFRKKCEALQQKMAGVVKASKMRFDEPWGMICLFWAGGSPQTA